MVAIEHVGSTAVPGLAAKPVIDMAVAIDDLRQAEDHTPILEGLGYQRYPEFDFEGRVFYAQSRGDSVTHCLSLTQWSTDFWRDHLLFRDYLRQHPSGAREYGDLKKRLAAAHGTDRTGYTYAKTTFIENITRLGWTEESPGSGHR